MKKQKNILRCIAIVFIFFAMFFIIAASSEKKVIVNEQSLCYPYDLSVPDIIFTISFGH
jgi:hypothetical protein